MAELTVEEIQEPIPQAAPEPEAPAPEPEAPAPETAASEEPAEQEVADVSAEVSIAPKKRGRPPGSKNKKAQPKRRPREPTPELEPPEPPPPIDVNALLEPIFKAYMATSEMRKREARQQRYSTLFQGMVG